MLYRAGHKPCPVRIVLCYGNDNCTLAAGQGHAALTVAEMGDQCYDCKSPARICRALSVLWCAPTGSQYEVVLVKEDLGY